MKNGFGASLRVGLIGACALALSGCTTADLEAFAAGLEMAADDMAVTMTQVPPYECGLNARNEPVCDDTGDGFADRYGDPNSEFVHCWYYPPPVRINDYGEAFQYDGACDCWRREPSLDTYPQ